MVVPEAPGQRGSAWGNDTPEIPLREEAITKLPVIFARMQEAHPLLCTLRLRLNRMKKA